MTTDTRHTRLLIGLGVVAAILLAKIFSIQVLDDHYKIDADNNTTVREIIYPTRGVIYDRNGDILVGNKVAYDILVSPRDVQAFDTLALATALDTTVEFIRGKMQEYEKNRRKIGFQSVTMIKQIPAETYNKFAEVQYRFPGFKGQVRGIRDYPINAGGNLLGYVSEVNQSYIENHPGEYRSGDYAGMTGIEAAREKDLRGEKGYHIFLRNSHNQIEQPYKDGEFDKEAIPGHDIVTTIDARLQQYGQELMQNKVGAIVAIEPGTGEILSLVSSPGILKGHNSILDTIREKVDPDSSYLWFHASSLGEFEQGRPLIERIHNKHPECKILLTFFSPSGYEVRKDYKGADIVCYIPFDTPINVKRFLNAIKIEKAFFIKYEFWPNFLRGLHKRNIEIFSVSSIFRDNQLFFKWYGKGYAKALTYFKHLFVQDRHSKDLLKSIGITEVSIVGDTRADRVLEVAAASKQFPVIEKFVNGDPTFIAGSSWPADEELFIPYFQTKPNWKLIIAPHEIHEEHLVQIESMLQGRDHIRLSQATLDNIKGYDTLIIDCFGMLSSIYRYGHIAYIGGGFGVGIHNVLEAAVFDIPVLFGPNNQRFREAQDLKRLKGGFEITDAYSLRVLIDKFISNPTALKKAGRAAGDYVRSSSGTSDKILDEIGLD